jgi:hypothetical protein
MSGMVVHSCNSRTGRQRQDLKFETSLGYILSSRSTWAKKEVAVSKQEKNQPNKKQQQQKKQNTKGWEYSSVVEHLPSMYQVLGLTPLL